MLRFDNEKGRVSLGRKQLLSDPWANAPERFPVGTRVQGKVAGVTDYGAFVELDSGVEGLVHISEMSWSKRMKHPSKVVAVGDPVEVVVLDIKPEQRRISLGLKQTTPDPWQEVAEKYPDRHGGHRPRAKPHRFRRVRRNRRGFRRPDPRERHQLGGPREESFAGIQKG